MISIYPYLICCAVLVLYFRPKKRSDVGSLPCPPRASLFWGHELEVFERNAGEFYSECIDKYGPTYRIKGALGHPDILVLADPVGIAHLSRNIYNYRFSAVFQSVIERLLGRGVLWAQDESEHKKMRRFLNPVFSADSVKFMTTDIYVAAAQLQARLKEQVYDGDGSIVVNTIKYCSEATLDVIGRVGFGHDFSQGIESELILQAHNRQVSLGMEFTGFIAPLVLRLFPFLTSLPISIMQTQGEVKAIIKRLGARMIEHEDGDVGGKRDLLSILLRENAKEKDPISQDQMLDHISSFVWLGYETTSISLSYTLWELARNPEKQKQLREVMGFTGDPTYDDLQAKLPYLDACCKEGLRVHPAASHTEHIAADQDTIPVHFPVTKSDGSKANQVTIERGQVVYLPIISINRLKSVWGDGDEFRPERWLEPNKGIHGVKIEGWNNTYTFGDGPRTCIGYRLAVLEMKILMLVLVRNFVFHDTGALIKSKWATGLHPYVIGRKHEGAQLPIRVTLAS